MAHEIIKKSEKDTHDTREATKAAEKLRNSKGG
jgi:2-polyprenyl-3-methyl-5-hydroxy-6-metoxy-1,4-benzoquinol methylase